jgi:hypothetical protein
MPARRQCIPSTQRDQFVSHRRSTGIKEIGVRITERYIDEFLVFCQKSYGFTDPAEIRPEHLSAYGKSVTKSKFMKDTTKLKIREVLNWLEWLKQNDLIESNPVDGLQPTDFL